MTKKIKFLSALILIATPIVAYAEGETPIIVTGKLGFSYTVSQQGNFRVIRGQETASRKRFLLYVGKRFVHGTYGDSEVDFPLSEVKHNTVAAEVASR
jgi:hypothetical protein